MDKFICFGCWNNLNDGKGNLEKVMDSLNSYLASETPEDKTKYIIVTEPQKQKIIYPTNLKAGFDMLPKDIPIYMIMGNHDYETNGKKNTLFVNNAENPEDGNCLITNLEIEKSKSIANVELNLFKSIYSASTQTLLLMIDTSIYSSDAEEFLRCYNNLLPTTPFSSTTELEEYQNRLILDAVNTNMQHINKIIIVGHHPISGFKYKIKVKKGVTKEFMDLMDDIPKFFSVLEQIYSMTRERNIKYYYLCADYHSYQHGFITLKSNGMRIEQYIAGTGGTELDKDLPNKNEITESNDFLTYEMPAGDNVHNWGFLVCKADKADLKCEPVFLSESASVAGGKKRKSNKNKRSKKRRTRRRMQN